ncbi:LPXTG cell wall anchor domain-containing protein [Nocardiopsis sp. NPDC049922]|uniref:LPXTG cell wall anchor domain-containing protein n=1 Tax=Nocardiopsis sp. NPDC049922 TaxID=3155157 RepID=UPI0033E77770
MNDTARFAARRIIQGGATFAALGALTIATAVPANADVYRYGWAYADIAGGYGEASTSIATEDSAGNTFSGAVDEFLTVDAETSARIDADGVEALTMVESARIQVTAGDLDGFLDEFEDGDDAEEDSEDEETGEESDAEETPESSEAPADPEATEGDSEEPAEDDAPAEPAEPTTQPTEEPAVEAEQTPEPAAANTGAENPVVELDEENSELTSGEDEIVLDVTISGTMISTIQSWDGEVVHSVVPGNIAYNVNEVDASVVVNEYSDVWEVEEAGFAWTDAYTAGVLELSVPDQFVVTHPLGETIASVTEELHDGDNGDGDGGDDDSQGDDRNPPAEREEPEAKPEQRSAESLAQTGSPVVGLIAAGAAIAAGGGLAAFFARRKKNAPAADESSEG